MPYVISLYFAPDVEAGPIKVEFQSPYADSTFVSYRGGSSFPAPNAKLFKWTAGLQALTILLLLHSSKQAKGEISGESGSAAASLDYAITKEPAWLTDLFGSDGRGNCNLRRILARRNAERKVAGPVTIWLSPHLPKDSVRIFIAGKLCSNDAKLLYLAQYFNRQYFQSDVTEASLCEPSPPVAPATESNNKKNTVEIFTSSNPGTLKFHEEWQMVVDRLVQNTRKDLRAMVYDSELKNWWTSAAGILYMTTNYHLVKQSKNIRRILLLHSADRATRRNAIKHALLHNKLGMQIKICLDTPVLRKEFSSNIDMFSVHDTSFAANYQLLETPAKLVKITGKKLQQTCQDYDEIFYDRKLCLNVEDVVKLEGFRNDKRLFTEVDEELNNFKNIYKNPIFRHLHASR